MTIIQKDYEGKKEVLNRINHVKQKAFSNNLKKHAIILRALRKSLRNGR